MRRILRLLLVLILVAAALLSLPYLRYRRTAGIVPAWATIGGLEVHGSTESEATASLTRGLEEPLEIFYADQRTVLRPQTVGFRVDTHAMLKQAQALDMPVHLIRYLVEDSLERAPRTLDIPLTFRYNEGALQQWIAGIAASYDRAPGAPTPILETLTLAPGKPGTQLDQEAAKAVILDGLAKPGNRSVTLPVVETPPLPIDVAALGTLLQAILDEFPGISSVWVHHVPSGEEVAINADVAYAGTSTLKIPILAQVYRKLDGPPGIDTAKIISETMTYSGNFTANLMLGIIGDGDWNAGVAEMNRAFKTLGMKNTFMATPYDRQMAVPPRIVTEANQRTDINTEPDPYMQTTPRDIGSSLQMLVECSEGGGTMVAVYGDAITPEECQQALKYMSYNEMTELLVGGLPEGAQAVHKHGYVPDTHGDVAAIWGPAGPYVLSVFLYRPHWLEWHYSNPTMQELARATWNVFEQMAQGQAGTPAAPADD